MTHNSINLGPKIALFEPDIPQNTAAIIRTCSCLGAKLEIIEPCGFLISDKRFKRIVMDYMDEKDINFYRAALMSAEHLRLFDPRIPDGLFQQAQKLAAPNKKWYERGLLLGNVEPSIIKKKVHDSNRLARIDWVLGYIDLNQFRHQVIKSILLVYAADASPELHVLLIEEINKLNSL